VSPLLRQHSSVPSAPPVTGKSKSRPVVLATLAVPFDPESARVALQAAMEGQVCLIVVDAVEMPLWPQAMAVRRADLELDEDREQIRKMVGHAQALGLEVEHLRVRSPCGRCSRWQVSGRRGCWCWAPTRPG